MAFISSLFLSELTFQRSSVVTVVVKGMTSSFQFFGKRTWCPQNIGPQTAVYSEKSISEFYLFEITGLCFSIRRYSGIRGQHRTIRPLFEYRFILISGYDFQQSIS